MNHPLEAKSADESLHSALPKFLKFDEPKRMETQEEIIQKEETKNPERSYEEEVDDINDRMEQIQKEDKEIILPGERPGSPIVPALRKKLLQSNTFTPADENQDIKKDDKPKRSVTQIGQREESKHVRNQSVTKLGINENESEDVLKENKEPPFLPEESKEFRKPPLAKSISYGGDSKKLMDGIEAKFQKSKHRKFTVSNRCKNRTS
jgi:hypothetical protein